MKSSFLKTDKSMLLNGICPYFTMFPLEFPLRVIQKNCSKRDVVVDPFCGRGTTNFAASLLGIKNFGLDSSPVAAAISAAKLVSPTPVAILKEAERILNSRKATKPTGQFWKHCFHKETLSAISKMRRELLKDCSTPERIALRGIVLGALHGPRGKIKNSYFSNQCPRTYAPKPAYSVNFWKRNKLKPPKADLLQIISDRAFRYYSEPGNSAKGRIVCADSREASSYRNLLKKKHASWIITSPPYYGMRTYIPDQWLRLWFLGGPEEVCYSNKRQLSHKGASVFAGELKKVWKNAADFSVPSANLLIRFGGISDRNVNPLDILKSSIMDTPWKIKKIADAGVASNGKRQADSFFRNKKSKPMKEYDIWLTKEKSR